MSLQRTLVISLGNPAPFTNTLHSAGHIVLQALQRQGLLPDQPVFSAQAFGKRKAPASIVGRYTFLQSPIMMNVSGDWVSKVWKADVVGKPNDGSPRETGLVLVHDDLEENIGVVKIRTWTSSARGHNGIKSVQQRLKLHQGALCARISVGIGRPEARDKADVSNYVLGKIPSEAKDFLENRAPALVLEKLMELEKLWEEKLKAEEPA